MTKSFFRICAVLALSFAASQAILSAQTIVWGPQAPQDASALEGIWDVSVTVRDCQTGGIIRTVRSVQMFSHDGSQTETANTSLRGSSLGSWSHGGGQTFLATFWFFRYKPDGTFASIAKALDVITLTQGSNQFTASGTIQDFDANNVLISTGCFTHAANRLSGLGQGR